MENVINQMEEIFGSMTNQERAICKAAFEQGAKAPKADKTVRTVEIEVGAYQSGSILGAAQNLARALGAEIGWNHVSSRWYGFGGYYKETYQVIVKGSARDVDQVIRSL